MTRRQQLILFVLGLATVSICTVAFAMTMSMWRQTATSATAADRLLAATAQADGRLAWQVAPTPVGSPPIVPVGPGGEPVYPPTLTSTPTRFPTATNTRVPTWTPSPTYTPTATRIPTDTPVPTPTDTPTSVPPSGAPASQSESQPPAPTATPTPEFPYEATAEVFDTGTPQTTRVTGMVWRVTSVSLALYDGEPGYQMRLVDPNGGVHLSDVSGLGGTDSRNSSLRARYLPGNPGTRGRAKVGRCGVHAGTQPPTVCSRQLCPLAIGNGDSVTARTFLPHFLKSVTIRLDVCPVDSEKSTEGDKF
jgi:hypothetical protein